MRKVLLVVALGLLTIGIGSCGSQEEEVTEQTTETPSPESSPAQPETPSEETEQTGEPEAAQDPEKAPFEEPLVEQQKEETAAKAGLIQSTKPEERLLQLKGSTNGNGTPAAAAGVPNQTISDPFGVLPPLIVQQTPDPEEAAESLALTAREVPSIPDVPIAAIPPQWTVAAVPTSSPNGTQVQGTASPNLSPRQVPSLPELPVAQRPPQARSPQATTPRTPRTPQPTPGQTARPTPAQAPPRTAQAPGQTARPTPAQAPPRTAQAPGQTARPTPAQAPPRTAQAPGQTARQAPAQAPPRTAQAPGQTARQAPAQAPPQLPVPPRPPQIPDLTVAQVPSLPELPPITEPLPQWRDPNAPLTPPPTAVAPATPVLPPPPSIEIAKAISVTGVMQVGDQTRVILKAPTEPTSRYVSVGQTIANGQVLVKRVKFNVGSEPIVIFEQNGVEVAVEVGTFEQTDEQQNLIQPSEPSINTMAPS
ncbi:MAG: hypothetical protein KA714_16055 [Limnoraphis sp. WC205]|nr:hypothetical protein [Limnoraphis sp. WC205]